MFIYEDPKATPLETPAVHINPYLIDFKDVFLDKRSSTLCNVPEVVYGSFALDGGYYTLNGIEREELLAKEPNAVLWLRRFVGAEELLYDKERWCLWLGDAAPADLKRMPHVMERVEAVRNWRRARVRATTVKLADSPTLFSENRQPRRDYIAIPKVSSERRPIMP
ncbi:MAG: type IIL restriction-modification enzyme MmeI [Flavobacteriales bacterium]